MIQVAVAVEGYFADAFGNGALGGQLAYQGGDFALVLAGGGFRHLMDDADVDGMATEQGYYALAAYYRLTAGKTSLYDMTDVKLEGVKAEEPVDDTDKSDDTADTEVEDTSSGGQVVLWVVIGVVAVGGIAALAVTSKKRHGRDAE